MTAPNLRPLSFGEILDGAFTLYRRNFVTFLLTALLPIIGIVALLAMFGLSVFAAAASGDAAAIMGALGGMFLMFLLMGLIYLVMWNALTREASQAYLAQPTSLADGFAAGVRKLLPALGASFLMFIAFIAVYFAVAILFVVLAGIGSVGGSGVVAALFGFVGFVAAIAIVLSFIAMLFGVYPAILVENKGPLEAISRSFDLARGALPRIVGLMLVTLIIVYLPAIAVMWLTGSFENMTNPEVVPSMEQFLTQQLLGWGVNILTMPFMVAVIVLTYFDRRVRTEALDVQLMTDQLAVAGD
jgi:hypothetical protein